MPAKKKGSTGPKQYIRNTRHVPVSVRLDTGRRLELRPRGQRGDSLPINDEEMQDEKFLGNVGILFEVIPTAEAQNVIQKQTTNQQSVHPALAHLKNERGEQYEKGVVVEENYTDQGKAVAVVNERGQIERFRAPGSVDNPLPDIPADVPPEEVSDWVARQRNVEGPEAGLGPVKVTKSDVQRES
jgi:hypothetical protein